MPPPDTAASAPLLRPRDPACPPLPARRPDDWSVRFERTTLPIHRPPTREAATLATSCAGREPPCQAVAPADHDALYAAFQQRGFSGDWEVNAPGYRSPHHGSRELSARWGGSECRVHDGRATGVDPAHEQDFEDLRSALLATLERAQSKASPAASR
ncbi:MAG: hypothetical protein EOO75_17250 [Myxococcales bacterium]|nr:MAG: hypothetical protein EOO75_17250 [Myxococcales bacterium]